MNDSNHRPSCFKKGPECRTENSDVAKVQFKNDKRITWHLIDGSIKKMAPFIYRPKRNTGDQFMNINNGIATNLLACSNM